MVSPPTSTCALPPSSHLFEKQSTQQALEKHKRKPEALRGWCIYWLVMGLYTVGVQISDRFIFWVPMYCEAKVGFVVYLWHPRTQGAIYIYETFILPFLAKHEPDIDRHLDETRTSVGDVAVRHSQAAANFVREKFAQALASLPQARSVVYPHSHVHTLTRSLTLTPQCASNPPPAFTRLFHRFASLTLTLTHQRLIEYCNSSRTRTSGWTGT